MLVLQKMVLETFWKMLRKSLKKDERDIYVLVDIRFKNDKEYY
jgi:hypothetical protein